MNRLALLVLLGVALPARAEKVSVDSIEWRTVQAPLIVRGKVIRCKDVRVADDQRTYRDVTIALTESLKGGLEAKTVTIRFAASGEDRTGLDWKGSGHEYLFFLKRWRKGEGDSWDAVAMAEQITLTDWVIDLDSPTEVYTAEQTLAQTAREILDTVRRYAKLPTGSKYKRTAGDDPTKRGTGVLRLEVDSDTLIWRALYRGSSVYICVPADEKRKGEALVMLASLDPRIRAVGVAHLAQYRGPAIVKLLRERLNDPGQVELFEGGKLVLIRYPVREAAYKSLIEQGGKPDKAIFERKPTAEEVRQIRPPE